MARRIGIKQDTMLYKVRVFSTNPDGEERGLEYVRGPYETIGVAKSVGACKANWCNSDERRRERSSGVMTGINWQYEIIKGRLVWFEGEK